MSRHAKPWNMAISIHDEQFPRLFPGEHHPIQDKEAWKATQWNSSES